MILIYVSNKQIDAVDPLVSRLRSEGKRLSFRNPRYFDKAEKAEKIYVYGVYPEVVEAYKNVTVWTGEEEVEKESQGEPSMDWSKKELGAYADANGIDVDLRERKESVLDAVLSHSE